MRKCIQRTGYVLSVIILSLVCVPVVAQATDVSSGDIVAEQSVSEGDIISDTEENETEASVSGGDISIEEEQTQSPENSGADVNVVSEISDTPAEIEVITAVLPTDFLVLMYQVPGEEGLTIQSQDILVINQNEYPIEVLVKDITYTIEGESFSNLEDSSLVLSVKEYEKEAYAIAYAGKEFVPFYLELEAADEATDAEGLLKQAESWNPIGAVEHADYTILRLEGTIDDENLREEDVEVGIVFEFAKAED